MTPTTTRTQVAIVGAGPAGLLLGQILHVHGIESVIVETRSREYVEKRIRAGVLEQGTVEVLEAAGVAERLHREGLVHHGLELRFGGAGHRVALSDLTGGRTITIYGQTEVVKDLIGARTATDRPLLFEATDVAVCDFGGDEPRVTFSHDGRQHELRCDAIAGCDGFHGISRASLADDQLTVRAREYPFAWLGVLAAVAPSTDELIYAYHERGFAMHSLRSAKVSRLYLQVAPDEEIASWSDDRIWEELNVRLAADGWSLREGPIVEKGITPMRSFVAAPMRHGRLFLAGDAAHIVPPTGAKGLNLAVSDVAVLADALVRWLAHGDASALDEYGDTCLRRIWRAQHFSWWMTSMLHRFPDDDGFAAALQLSQLEYVCGSQAAATTLAENYVGLARDQSRATSSEPP